MDRITINAVVFRQDGFGSRDCYVSKVERRIDPVELQRPRPFMA